LNFFSGSAGAQCTLGSITLNVAVQYPDNYVPADGRLLAINTDTALFSLIGTNYGGNGTTNFALPDLRSAAPNNTQYLICISGVFP
ncbi:MAG: phage tail protein, partial [Acidobacteriaceae bacterium]